MKGQKVLVNFLNLRLQENDASIILEDKTFQNPSSVSCLEGIPDFRVLPPLPLLPKFKAGSKISSFRRILYLAILQVHSALKTSFPLEAVIFGQIEEPRFYLILISHSAPRNHKRSGQMHCAAHLPAVFFSPNLTCVRWIHPVRSIPFFPTSPFNCFLNLFRRKLR